MALNTDTVVRGLAWTTAGVVLAVLAVWPIVAGVAATTDDVGWVNLFGRHESVADSLRTAWGMWRFRPLDILAFQLVDPVSRDARAIMCLQLPPVLVIVVGIRRGLKLLNVRDPLALPLVLAWWGMATGTCVSLWQPDTVSQTWCAAVGLWLILTVWSAGNRAAAGRLRAIDVPAICGLTVLGVLTKLTFFGWCGGALVLLVILRFRWRGGRGARLPWLALILPVVLIPAVYFVIRTTYGGLAEVLEGEGERYGIHLGGNLPANMLMSMLGFFATGPVHVLRWAELPWAVRIVPIAGVMVSLIVMAAPWMYVRSDDDPPPMPWKTTVVLVAICFSGLAVTLPLGQMSELYLMGPNFAAAILGGMGLAFLAPRRWTPNGWKLQSLEVLVLLAALGVGAMGMTSRCAHFSTTWTYSRVLFTRLVDVQSNLPPDQPRTTLHLNESCTFGYFHSVYLGPPSRALVVEETEHALNRMDPTRQVRITEVTQYVPDTKPDVVLDCADLPSHPRW